MFALVAAAIVAGVAGAAATRHLAVRIAPGALAIPRWRSGSDAVVTAAAVAVALVYAPTIAAGTGGVAAVIAAQIATHIDTTYRVIPNRLTYRMPVVLAALTLFGWLTHGTAEGIWLAAALGVIAPFVLYSVSAVYQRYTGLNGFGMGDIKLVGSLTYATALWGSTYVAAYAYATFVSAAIVSSVLLIAGRATRTTRVAFAPYFLVGVTVAVVMLPVVAG